MKLSVIIPCYNEEEVIHTSYQRFTDVMRTNSYDYELVMINDGSRDNTLNILTELAHKDKNVKVISFSRNFGHQNAVTAGLHNCTGDVAVIIDADLQDPPEVIPQMIETYVQEGSNVVYAVRNQRKGESLFKLLTAKMYYRTLNYLSDFSFPVDTGDFRLIDRQVINTFKKFPEKHKYLRGLFTWMGFKQTPFYYDRDERAAGKTKYSFGKMIKLASVGIFGFSKKPLKLAISLGSISMIFALGLVIWILYLQLFAVDKVVPGWSSTIITILFLGGIQLFTIGILGEYIGNIFDETKNRPEYIIQEKLNFDTDTPKKEKTHAPEL
ncbi:glycosyltransferase family 2 protein [Coprobacter tertius]|uniref:Glycosyltransferase family 2 protein n=1 Tax=Coprobacter tertius TaxID=2944915 RepID=A0ABT1MEK8_9BACT|nr:glycosyltransferase family 2 protein [Coprobacter tertius]MCP9611059.1 glycosyltransferase family 2 protein [Coprobacter tertius]